MDFGLDFFIGLLGGAVAAAIVAVLVAASRRAAGGKAGKGGEPPPPPPATTRGTADPGAYPAGREPTRVASRRVAAGPAAGSGAGSVTRVLTPDESLRLSSGNTMVIGKLDEREGALNRNVQEVRDLLLRLADAVSATESASGEAAVAFKSAKDAIDKFDFNASDDLAGAQAALIREIDRVVSSNAKLHAELDKANQGIAEQRRQIEELRVQARVDALTGIPNRASFDERLREYIGLLDRASLAFTLMILDIDHFKMINDNHGHVNGDRILRGVATRIAGSVRNNDFAARYGGEEFAVIFPGAGEAEALVIAERVRQDIGKTKFRLDSEVIKTSVSGGLAEGRKGMSPDAVIAAADAALYRAKSSGRNQILSAGGLDSREVKRL